ncbi:putative UDP-N-acetylglucosamine--peptide N-acetylglucosaminyltransferase SPINDLY [Hordeum vulgare]|nr:putative UDP-N-acetylglucosamine--peptide N-acetylglucosaminyltransferase SPINDLY [Hordeum vulgare]
MIEERNVTLEEKMVKIAANAEDAKILSLKVDSLDADERMIVQSIGFHMLEREKDVLAADDYEDAGCCLGDNASTSLIGKQLVGIVGSEGQKCTKCRTYVLLNSGI